MGFGLEKFKNKKICVALSGGVDSMVLLHFLKENREKYGYRLLAVNFEHGIRGEESVADSLFVEQVCMEWGIPLFSFSENCIEKAKREKQSLETAARNFRLFYYEKLIKSGESDYIATAHHANDEVETVLFRLCRGTSLSGISGIKAETGYFIRPLIEWTKAEILSYAAENRIGYREDSTNRERIAARNALRLDVLPTLEKIVPGAAGNIVRFSNIVTEDDELLYELANELILYSNNSFEVKFSNKKPLFRRACLNVMKELGIDKNYTFTHLDDLFDLQFRRFGAVVCLPNGVRAKKSRTGVAFFDENQKEKKLKRISPTAFAFGKFKFGDYELIVTEDLSEIDDTKNVLRLDADKLPNGVVFRSRREKDVFRKFGGGAKSLKKYLIDKKIPCEKRDVPLIADENGNTVYAIFGVEISENVKIDEKTKKTVYITVKNIGE